MNTAQHEFWFSLARLRHSSDFTKFTDHLKTMLDKNTEQLICSASTDDFKVVQGRCKVLLELINDIEQSEQIARNYHHRR